MWVELDSLAVRAGTLTFKPGRGTVFTAVVTNVHLEIDAEIVLASMISHQRQSTAAGNSVSSFLNNSWRGVGMDIAVNGQSSSALS
ncbi:hypothetical protein WAI453_013619 [Rhynchosporium graminicola]